MDKNNKTEWAKYSGLGIQMVVSVIICLYIGKWVGIKLGSENLGALFGTLFGLFASIYNLIKQIKNWLNFYGNLIFFICNFSDW